MEGDEPTSRDRNTDPKAQLNSSPLLGTVDYVGCRPQRLHSAANEQKWNPGAVQGCPYHGRCPAHTTLPGEIKCMASFVWLDWSIFEDHLMCI